MKRIVIAAIAMLTLAAAAHAAEGMMGGLGFRTLNGPSNQLENSGVQFSVSPAIGIRQWFSEKVGLDLAIGFTSLSVEGGSPSKKADEGSGFVIDVGIPIAAKKWDKVNFIFRPGFQYGSAKAKDKLALVPPNESTSTILSVSGELEVEYMLADKLSVSAAHGIAYRSFKVEDNASPKSEGKVTGFDTTGDNFTQLGFHVYLW